MRVIFSPRLNLLFSAFIFLFLPLQLLQAAEQNSDVFSIYNISVDRTARTASEAQSQALLAGQRQALNSLFAKIIRPEDVQKLPDLDDSKVTSLVSGLDIAQERTSTVRYIANLTVHFSRDQVFDLLSALNIPFAETKGKALMVLPVMEKAGAYTLWETQNTWRAFWQGLDNRNNLVPYVLPDASYTNIYSLNARQAYYGQATALTEFARRHQVDDLLIPIISLPPQPASGTAAYLGPQKLTLTVRRGLSGEIMLQQDVELQSGQINHLSEVGHDLGHDPATLRQALFQAAFDIVHAAIETDWKNKVLVNFGDSAKLTASFDTKNVRDWPQLQNTMSSMALILKTTVDDISPQQVILTIYYAGTLEQLKLSLEQKDFVLQQELDKWQILNKKDVVLPAAQNN